MTDIQGLEQLNESVNKLIEHDALVKALNNLSEVRPYDESILSTAQTANTLAQEALTASQVANDMTMQSLTAMMNSNIIAVVAVCVSCTVALITLFASAYIYYRQEIIIKKQLSVAEAQNNITLFEKRYALYLIFKGIILQTTNLRLFLEKCKEKEDFLTNSESYKYNILYSYLLQMKKSNFFLDIYNDNIDFKSSKDKMQLGLQIEELSNRIKYIAYIFNINDKDKILINTMKIYILEALLNFQKDEQIDNFLDIMIKLENLTKDKQLQQLQKKLESQLKLHDNLKD